MTKNLTLREYNEIGGVVLQGVAQAVRSLRDAAVAGVIWMLAIWVDFPTQLGYRAPVSTLAEEMHPVGDALQNVGVTVGLLIVAVIIGSVSVQVFRAPSLWIANLSTLATRFTEAAVIRMIEMRTKSRKLRRFDSWEPLAIDLARRVVHHHREEILQVAGTQVRAVALERLVYTEFDILKYQELHDPSKVANFIRELNGQAQFRLTMIVPLIAINMSLVLRFGSAFALLMIFPFIIAFQAVDYKAQRDLELESEIWPQIDVDKLAKSIPTN